MKVETTLKGLRAAVKIAKKSGKTVALVPTMGNLHEGHLTLVKEAVARSEFVVVSIFVNPTQFGENEDFDSYPRTLDADYDKLANTSCNLVFAPSMAEIYPNWPENTMLSVGSIANQLCGKSRPGHFDGMATIVTKLFNMVTPDIAFFGEKDYQQLAIIRQFSKDLHFDLDIMGIPIVRNKDGLALSSRNGYLNEQELATASLLNKCLQHVGKHLLTGIKQYDKLTTAASQYLEKHGFVVDYLEIRQLDLSLPDNDSREFIVLVAAKLGSTRLIDNMQFSLD